MTRSGFAALPTLVSVLLLVLAGGCGGGDDDKSGAGLKVFGDVGPGGGGETGDASGRVDLGPRPLSDDGLTDGVTIEPDNPCERSLRPDGCECTEFDQCESGYCVATEAGMQCVAACVEKCEDGFACVGVRFPPDIIYLCLPRFEKLCQPCTDHIECQTRGDPDLPTCRDYGELGRFCTAACEKEGDCPEGYTCAELDSPDGGVTLQCVRDDGVCECNNVGKALGMSTACDEENDHGICEGRRTCGDDGLSDCDAAVPAEETCNEVDDDCDGQTDEDAGCGAPIGCQVDPAICDNGDPCTVDACGADGVCTHEPAADGTACDDGNACTDGDACALGECAGTMRETCCSEEGVCVDGDPCTVDTCSDELGCLHEPKGCDDGDPCSEDTCAEDGQCRHAPRDCDDADPCTVDACGEGGECSHEPKDCDDSSECTEDSCDEEGECQHAPVEDGTGCDDSNECTDGDACTGGECGGTLREACCSEEGACDDGDPCTVDGCSDEEGCSHEPKDCDDGYGCTVDSCGEDGECLHLARDCDDENPCTADSCESGECVHTVDSACAGCAEDRHCLTDNPCTPGRCVVGTGCVFEPRDCDDEDPCTTDTCIPEAPELCVHIRPPLECDDGNPCTIEVCGADGECTHEAGPDGEGCDDGNACTDGDACAGGLCVGVLRATCCSEEGVCDDGDLCTVDSCSDEAGCAHEPKDCDDDNVCTLDSCVDGVCLHSPGVGLCECFIDLDCDDDNPCTIDSCNVDLGWCSNELRECNDGDSCTVDRCDAASGDCAHQARDCDDGDACTSDSCDPLTPEACEHAPVDCDDGEVCTDDSCDPASGCVHDAVADETGCDDDNECTDDDACASGVCTGVLRAACCSVEGVCDDGDPCTADDCSDDAGCTHVTKDCDDANPCTEDACNHEGLCTNTPKDCDDLDPCTIDWCGDGGECEHEVRGCDDGDPCTEDSCDADGECVSEIIECDDGDPCTEDSCEGDAGECFFDPVECEDLDPCTVDSCEDGDCVHALDPDCELRCEQASDCEDGNPCTKDGCTEEGTCAYAPADCDDGDFCTVDVCDSEVLGGCVHVAGDCDDGDPCTEDSCLPESGCVNEEKVCDDGDPCTEDVCGEDGGCWHGPGNDGASCDDADPCTDEDSCAGGLCGGTPVPTCCEVEGVCDDGDPCTVDTCDAETGCTHEPGEDAIPCDDSNPCTAEDACAGGLCEGSPVEGCCNTDADCDDGDPCNGIEVCASGTCKEGVSPDCDDGEICTLDGCVEGEGCIHDPAPAGTVCGDGGPCAATPTCLDGACRLGELTDCDDGNPCTVDDCDPEAGGCTHDAAAAENLSCDDGIACTEGDVCLAGQCEGTPTEGCCSSDADCEDPRPCRTGSCDATTGACVLEAMADETPCPDEDLCDGEELCFEGVCRAAAEPLDCDDEKPCTTDQCDPGTGCVHTLSADGIVCSDGDLCNGVELCTSGLCEPGQPPDCDDGNPCTADGCDPATGCTHVPDEGAVCDDEDVCNGTETCQGGVCQSTGRLVCDQNASNPCVRDLCHPKNGCYPEFVEDDWPCSDGDLCNGLEKCLSGVCMLGEPVDCMDDNPCTVESCDPQRGCVREAAAPGTSCADDDACNGEESCQGFFCRPGTPPDCDDGDPCSRDDCDPDDGCIHPNAENGTPCGDGDPCNGEETCQHGQCAPGDAPDCDDGDPCTEDACDPSLLCTHAPAEGGCDDGNVCTGPDQCQNGQCRGEPIEGCCTADGDCDDSNPCTRDECNAVTGACNLIVTPDITCVDEAGTEGVCTDEGTCETVPIRGVVIEDRDGDGNLGDGVRRAGVRIRVYRDNADGVPGAGDEIVANRRTGDDGDFSVAGLGAGTYWVTVDSLGLSANEDDGTWAEQTYGPRGSVLGSGAQDASQSFTSTAGPLFGGREAGSSDYFGSLTRAQHVARVRLPEDTQALVYGFSFQTVTNTRDGDDSGSGAATVQGSLRQLITNANIAAGPQRSMFRLTKSDSNYLVQTGTWYIRPTQALPPVEGPLALDATTQPDYEDRPLVILDGEGAGLGTDGLRLFGDDSEVRGFVIMRFDANGVRVDGDDNVVAGCFIGVGPTGLVERGNGHSGVRIEGGQTNRVGGLPSADFNVISGNGQHGVFIRGADWNAVQGNLIGLAVDAVSPIGNTEDGVRVEDGSENVVGGTQDGEGNIISANGEDGVHVSGRGEATENAIWGNYIGTDLAGVNLLPNEGDGIDVRADSTAIGSATHGVGNLISANKGAGIRLRNAELCVVEHNAIGTDVAGSLALGNQGGGIRIIEGLEHLVGGGTESSANQISANGAYGVHIERSEGVTVAGNLIGTTRDGWNALGNDGPGVRITDSAGVSVGPPPAVLSSWSGEPASWSNAIANNDGAGVLIDGPGEGNSVIWNVITDNGGLGIDLDGGFQNEFGVTDNDWRDEDEGPNGLQNAPFIYYARREDGHIRIRGQIETLPNASVRIDVYASPYPDPSWHGEGLQHVGSSQLWTGGWGVANFNLRPNTGQGFSNMFFTATASLIEGGTMSTSEFSQVVELSRGDGG